MQLSGYVSSVEQITEVNNKRKEQKVATKYFKFYFHTKDQVRRVICFSTQKRRILKEIEGGERGCTLKKTKFASDEKTQTSHWEPTQALITPSELSFGKKEHVLNYSSISRSE